MLGELGPPNVKERVVRRAYRLEVINVFFTLHIKSSVFKTQLQFKTHREFVCSLRSRKIDSYLLTGLLLISYLRVYNNYISTVVVIQLVRAMDL
jgi:hypothetical protein